MTNRDALVDALGDANVIMVLGGHYQAQLIEKCTVLLQFPCRALPFPIGALSYLDIVNEACVFSQQCVD